MNKNSFQWWVPLVSLLVLCGMQAWKATLPDGSAGDEFRLFVKSQMKDYPTLVGEWDGTDSKLPQEAIALLHPNVYVSRSYVNTRTHEEAGLLFIEAEDSRDMMGHYPPNCYPGNGWELVRTVEARNSVDNKPEWIVGDLHIPGKEYEFKMEREGRTLRKWVRSFFILPNNTFYPEIASFGRAASDFQIRPYGAAQVQVIYDREYLPEDRERIFQSMIGAHSELIKLVAHKELLDLAKVKG